MYSPYPKGFFSSSSFSSSKRGSRQEPFLPRDDIVQLIAAGAMAVKRYVEYLTAKGNGKDMDGDIFNSESKIQILEQGVHFISS